MQQERIPDFIIIDDDPFGNMLARRITELTLPGAGIKTFTDAELALGYILSGYSGNAANDAILFLDINMPILTGWDVLHRFDHFPDGVKKRVKIFMLSSSISIEDKGRARGNPLVAGYITKPLTQANLEGLFPGFVKTA
ncbi:MAG TPA: response regulator [Chitinophagaceae bacterium]|nr:response regulator [Chitinophagaceae bacterium]